jgi:hypothetical protein
MPEPAPVNVTTASPVAAAAERVLAWHRQRPSLLDRKPQSSQRESDGADAGHQSDPRSTASLSADRPAMGSGDA